VSINKMIITMACLLPTGLAGAAVYKSVDAQGKVTYSDKPVGNSQPVTLPPLSSVPPPSYKSLQPAARISPITTQVTRYKTLEIVTPGQDETVRDNTGNIPVHVLLKPALNKAAGHRLQYFLDGRKYGEPAISGQTLYTNIDRGTHTLGVAVVDASGKVLKRTAAIRIYMHRQSVNFPRGPGKPAPQKSR